MAPAVACATPLQWYRTAQSSDFRSGVDDPESRHELLVTLNVCEPLKLVCAQLHGHCLRLFMRL